MATAALSAAMNLEGKEVVHPFFRKAKSKILESIHPIETNVSANAAHTINNESKLEAIANDQVSFEPLPPQPTAVEEKLSTANGLKSGKRRSGSTGPKQATLDAYPLQREATPTLEPVSSHTPNGSPGNNGNALEVDPNYYRRKRQRTITPGLDAGRILASVCESPQVVQQLDHTAVLSWERQLQLQAEKSADGVKTTEAIVEERGKKNNLPVLPAVAISERHTPSSIKLGTAEVSKGTVLAQSDLPIGYGGIVPGAGEERDQSAAKNRKFAILISSPNGAYSLNSNFPPSKTCQSASTQKWQTSFASKT